MGKKKKVVVVGGGAAGLTAAIASGRNGAEVVILEQLQRVGKKILATGNGRCNLTNAFLDISRYHGNNTKIVQDIFSQFGFNETVDFFEGLGISCREEEGGKVYPWSGQASSVLDVLRYEVERLGIEERVEVEVKRIIQAGDGFITKLKDGSELRSDSVIVCTGGKANSNLGSTGMGYKLLQDLGHKLIEPFPALVQLRLNLHFLKALSGVKFEGRASILKSGKILRSEAGEILFTDYGISGPPILQLSRKAGEVLTGGGVPYISIDMFPEFTAEDMCRIVDTKLGLDGNKAIDFCFIGLLNKKLIPTFLKLCGINEIHKPAREVSDEEREHMATFLKKWDIEVIGTQPWKDAQVTAGGIDVRDIDAGTMQSKIVKGLYCAGEILDIDGDCGGFNLQWAWASGYIAGINSSK